MASVWTKVLSGESSTGKNVHVQVNGWLDPQETLDWSPLVKAAQMHTASLRLDSVNYAISDKTEVLLAWDKAGEGEEPHVFLPLNGRGRLDFDAVNGLKNTVGDGKTGDVIITAYSTADLSRRSYFTLSLDFSKQGN